MGMLKKMILFDCTVDHEKERELARGMRIVGHSWGSEE